MTNVKSMTSQQLREAFLDYFKVRGHEGVPSSSLIPANDPTLLFVNAGMVQFKETFLGQEKRSYNKAVSIQRCVRAGGKHNDLENVGYTARHHTLFEMLGNFSFGDYFKREAIEYAWRFLTEVLELPVEKLWVTVFREDQESEAIWLNEIGVDPERFVRCGEKDNFWQMGDTGPCGPCTEIFYDHGPQVEGGPPGSRDQDGDRYVEVWNLVFMEYERDFNGKLTPLPKPCVDTGMGLERLAAVMQGVHDNYDIDTFKSLLQSLAEMIGEADHTNTSMRVIVDHIRSAAFLIADGVIPSNEGRGYVLRKIIRRAVRHGYKLGQQKVFFHRLVGPLVTVMGKAYPGLVKSQALIEQIIEQEEQQFATTLSKGLRILDQEIMELAGHEIPGDLIFLLYDTYGFSADLTADIAKERGYTMDYAGFQAAMQRQREQSQQAQQFNIDQIKRVYISGETEFTGYHSAIEQAEVTALLQDDKPVSSLKQGQKGAVVLDRTPFYAESGGQVGDSGYLYFNDGRFRVSDTKKHGEAFLHFGEVMSGDLKLKEKVRAEIDIANRRAIMLNHTATHLLHEALRRVLGDHVQQKGSLVEAKRLRFDFSHPKALTWQDLQAIERLVNQQIRANIKGKISEMTPDEAKEQGALALFGERYGDEVRVLKLGDFSTEICGGTHVGETGDIGLFKIVAESASASGVRRIEAMTGDAAILFVESQEIKLQEMSDLLKTSKNNVIHKLTQTLEQYKQYEREISQLKQSLANQQIARLSEQAIDIAGVKVLAAELDHTVDRDTMRNTIDQLKHQFKSAAIVLASIQANKVQLVAGISKDCLKYFSATELLNQVAHQVGGKGGGRADMAQGGGDLPHLLPEALSSVAHWARTKFAS